MHAGKLVRELNAVPKGRAEPELKHGQVWDTEELGRDYEVIGFPLRSWWCEGGATDGGNLIVPARARYFGFSPD